MALTDIIRQRVGTRTIAMVRSSKNGEWFIHIRSADRPTEVIRCGRAERPAVHEYNAAIVRVREEEKEA